LKCTKFDFGYGSAPDPAGELKALPRPLAGFKGSYLGGRSREERRGKGGKGRRKRWMAPFLNS